MSKIPKVINKPLADKLAELFKEAVRRLQAISDETIVIAESPNKFNDAWDDAYWHAVRVGDVSWQESDYFSTPEKPKILPTGQVEPPATVEAYKILFWLHEQGWRDLAHKAFEAYNTQGDNYSNTIDNLMLAIVIFENQPYLLLDCASECGECFWLNNSGNFYYICDTSRIDHSFDEEMPLIFGKLDLDKIEFYPKFFKQFLLPKPVDQGALARLINSIEAAVDTIKEDYDGGFYYSTAQTSKSHFGPEYWKEYPILTLADKQNSETYFHYDKALGLWDFYDGERAYNRMDEVSKPILAKIMQPLGGLEAMNIRGMWEKAYGEKLRMGQWLKISVTEEGVIVTREHTMMKLHDSKLEYSGNIFDSFPD